MRHFNTRKNSMRLLPFVSIFVSFISIISITHSNSITFFLRTYAFQIDKNSSNKLKSISKPGNIAAKVLKNSFFTLNLYQGIFSTYRGYLTFSDIAGQSTFPRKQKSSALKILVTQSIDPVFMIGNTIHHWQISPSQQAKLYSLDQFKNQKTKELYWKILSIDLPENRRIGLDTIVIFAHPKNIYIPEGNFKTYDSFNLILPDIYVKKNLNTIHPALWVLNVRQFFGSLVKELKKESDTYYSKQV